MPPKIIKPKPTRSPRGTKLPATGGTKTPGLKNKGLKGGTSPSHTAGKVKQFKKYAEGLYEFHHYNPRGVKPSTMGEKRYQLKKKKQQYRKYPMKNVNT